MFADNHSMICQAVCTTHTCSLCHSDILPVCSPHYDTVYECQCLERGCIQNVLFLFGIRKTVLVISRSCSAHFLRSKRPLLLHFPTPSGPITPCQVWWSVPTLALKGTSRQRSGKGAIRKRFPLQKPRWEKTKLTIRYLYHETYRKPNEQLFSQ